MSPDRTLLITNADVLVTMDADRRKLLDLRSANLRLRGAQVNAIWARLTPERVAVSTQVAMAELLLSRCTTSSDQLCRYPNSVRLDHSLEAAQQIGRRCHAARGSMSVGVRAGGLHHRQRPGGGARWPAGHVGPRPAGRAAPPARGAVDKRLRPETR